jgi:hypothetical protein
MRRLFAATAILALSTVTPHHANATEPEVLVEQPGRMTRVVTVSLTPIERRLALAVAKVCVNEASWNSPSDCALIWQTAENRAQTPAGRLRWLTRHSSCVLDSTQAEADAAPGNCSWTRNLTRSTRRPDRYRGPWRAERWERVLGLADRLVAGQEQRRPCSDGEPFTWDGRKWRDGILEGPRRFRLLDCRGPSGRPTKNDGWAIRR